VAVLPESKTTTQEHRLNWKGSGYVVKESSGAKRSGKKKNPSSRRGERGRARGKLREGRGGAGRSQRGK